MPAFPSASIDGRVKDCANDETRAWEIFFRPNFIYRPFTPSIQMATTFDGVLLAAAAAAAAESFIEFCFVAPFGRSIDRTYALDLNYIISII